MIYNCNPADQVIVEIATDSDRYVNHDSSKIRIKYYQDELDANRQVVVDTWHYLMFEYSNRFCPIK